MPLEGSNIDSYNPKFTRWKVSGKLPEKENVTFSFSYTIFNTMRTSLEIKFSQVWDELLNLLPWNEYGNISNQFFIDSQFFIFSLTRYYAFCFINKSVDYYIFHMSIKSLTNNFTPKLIQSLHAIILCLYLSS